MHFHPIFQMYCGIMCVCCYHFSRFVQCSLSLFSSFLHLFFTSLHMKAVPLCPERWLMGKPPQDVIRCNRRKEMKAIFVIQGEGRGHYFIRKHILESGADIVIRKKGRLPRWELTLSALITVSRFYRSGLAFWGESLFHFNLLYVFLLLLLGSVYECLV